MKYPVITFLSLIIIAASALSGCKTKTEKMELAETSVINAEKDLEIAKSEVEAELRIFRAKTEKQIEGFNQGIKEIKQKIDAETDTEIKANLNKKLKAIENSHRELQSEMDNFKVSERDNWEEFKDNFAEKMHDLGNTLANFFTPSTATSNN